MSNIPWHVPNSTWITLQVIRLLHTRTDFSSNFSDSLRDALIERWNETQQNHSKAEVKRVYYLSMEFLIGRTLTNVVLNLDIKNEFGEALRKLGFRLEDVSDEEKDAALGNGGLGRLAACFMGIFIN
jgi:glucan phosphorylase